jgi:Flagellar hook-length control protein FliK
MNGIAGFAGKPSIALDARVPSQGAKTGDAAGSPAEFGAASAFGGHLADLSKRDSQENTTAALAGYPESGPALVQQSLRPAAGTAPAVVSKLSWMESGATAAFPVIAIPPANGEAADGTNTAARLADASGGTPATPPGSKVSVADRRVGENRIVQSVSTLDHNDFPSNRSKTTAATRSQTLERNRSGKLGATLSHLGQGGTPSLADGTREPVEDAAANEVSKVMKSHSGPGVGGNGVGSTPEQGLSSPWALTQASPAKRGSSVGTPPSSDPPGAGNVSLDPVAASRGGPLPPQDQIEPRTNATADPKDGLGSPFAASEPAAVLIVDQQSHFAPPVRLPSTQRTAHLSLAFAPANPASGESAQPSGDMALGSADGQGGDTQESAKSDAAGAAIPNGDHSAELAASAPVKEVVAKQQIHLAAPGQPSPAGQLAQTIISLAGPDKRDASVISAPSKGALDLAGAADASLSMNRVQTLQVQLEPESLGKVTVTMRLSGARLDLRVETEHSETMQMIGKEKDFLSGKLQAAGYAVETLVIQPAETKALQQPFGMNTTSLGQDQSAGQPNGGATAHDRPSTHDDRRAFHPALADDIPDGTGTHSSSGDLYL